MLSCQAGAARSLPECLSPLSRSTAWDASSVRAQFMLFHAYTHCKAYMICLSFVFHAFTHCSGYRHCQAFGYTGTLLCMHTEKFHATWQHRICMPYTAGMKACLLLPCMEMLLAQHTQHYFQHMFSVRNGVCEAEGGWRPMLACQL